MSPLRWLVTCKQLGTEKLCSSDTLPQTSFHMGCRAAFFLGCGSFQFANRFVSRSLSRELDSSKVSLLWKPTDTLAGEMHACAATEARSC
jgi:hypothetical protein